jgi:hypothetical protein
MTVDLHDPLVEKLLAVVEGLDRCEVSLAVNRFHGLVSLYVNLDRSQKQFAITVIPESS